jgi:uncharacterized protein (DUF1499 family)
MRFLAAAPFLIMFLGIGLSTIGVIPALLGFGLYVFSGLLGIIAVVLIYFTRIRKGMLQFRILAVVAGAPFFIVLFSAAPGLSYPSINDITTDLADPPQFKAALELPTNEGRDMAYPEDFIKVVEKEYQDLEPLVLDDSPGRVFQRALELVEAKKGWEVTADDPSTYTIEGTATSYFFGFVDDFVIRISDAAGKAEVDMRSKSRQGRSDLGANAKRINAFFAELSEAESGAPGE